MSEREGRRVFLRIGVKMNLAGKENINNNRQTDVAYPGLDVGYESGGRE